MNPYQANQILEEPLSRVGIRPMREMDLEQVHAIDEMSFSLPWPASAFRYELLENPHSKLWVAEINTPTSETSIVGAIVVWLILDEAHIATLATRPDFRRKGIGERLLITALISAAKHGSTMATLEVRESNLAAQALYHKFRFIVAGKRKQYYVDNREDAIIMTLASLDTTYLYWLESGEWQKLRFQQREKFNNYDK